METRTKNILAVGGLVTTLGIGLGVVAGGLVAALGPGLGLESREIKRECEKYQGYSPDVDAGGLVYVFDPDSIKVRPDSARYSLLGDPSLANSILNWRNKDNRYKRFCFEFREPIVPWGYRTLESVHFDSSQIQ